MPNKLKVAVLSAFYEPRMTGGAEKMVKEVAERLGRRHEITLVTGRFDRSVRRREEREHFRIIRVGIGHKQIDKFIYPVCAALQVRSLKPQIAHAIMESYAGAALVLAGYLSPGVKRILTLQSGDLDDDKKQSQWWIRAPWKLIHTSPHIITAISTFLRKRAIRLGAKPENVYLTPNGLDTDKAPFRMDKAPGRVCIASRLSWEKDHKSLLQAWPQVLQKFPQAELVVVGDGEERKNIEKLIKDLRIQGSVKLKGMLPHGQALAEIARAEAFVCPSLAEGLGNVFIEAQACGTPPIGTRVGGIPDVITHEKNGLLIEPGRPDRIAAAIIRLLSDRELAGRLKVAGLENAKRFDWDVVLGKIEEVYLLADRL